jgi:hypothetical protein
MDGCPSRGRYQYATPSHSIEMAMARELVSAGELIKILNEELAKYPEDAACEFTMIDFKLSKPDKTGCNWHSAEVVCLNGVLPRVIEQVTARIISAAKEKYNVE